MDGLKKYIAELIGTFVLTLFGCGTAVFVGVNTPAGVLATALAFGLSVVVMSVTIGNISGCHINPAISLGMFLDKRISLRDFIGYFIFQIIGALIAAFVLAVFVMGAGDIGFGELGDYTALGTNGTAGVHDSAAVALVVEIVLTFVFVLIALGATAKEGMGKFGGLFIGLGLTMVHLVGIPLTGTSVNPARSIGPAIVEALAGNSDPLGDVWIFIVAPLIGAVIAWAVWKFVLSDDAKVAE